LGGGTKSNSGEKKKGKKKRVELRLLLQLYFEGDN